LGYDVAVADRTAPADDVPTIVNARIPATRAETIRFFIGVSPLRP
jgi:hypothetical protein